MSVKTLKIDDRDLAIEQGATILQAAREAGIPIPTLCYLEGVSPAAACGM
jgi:bidirectional [NiFe] hydrogenase diaphorase subunit